MFKNLGGRFIIRSTFYVTLSSIFASVFSYAFQLVMGKSFSVVEYGILISLLSLYGVLTVPLNILGYAITKYVSEVKFSKNSQNISTLYNSAIFLSLVYLFSISSIMLIFKNQILNYLNIDFSVVFYPFVLYIVFTFLFTVNRSFFQGLKQFKPFSIFNLLSNFLKFTVSLFVYFFGLGLYFTFSLLSVFTLITGLGGFILLAKKVSIKLTSNHSYYIKKLIKFSFASSFGLLGLSFMLNNDVVLVKHFFNESISGYYGASVVVGRIIFFGVSPIAFVFFPICAERYFKGENYIRPFFQALIISTVLAGMGLIVFYNFPTIVINLLFGSKYLMSAEYLPLYSVYMFFYTIFAIFTWLLISISKLKLSALAFVVGIFQYFLVKLIIPTDISQVLNIFIITTVIGLGLYLLFMYKDIIKFVFKNGV